MWYSMACLVLPFVGLVLGADTTIVVTVPASIPSEEPSWADDENFTSAVLNSTNFYRTEHNASDVVWNATLEEFAVDYLDTNGCKFEHSGGPYGENLAMGYPNASWSVEGWGEERDNYNFKKGKFDEDTGHFTQLVWKNTTDVGCGRRLCGESGWYLVCEYWPRGNVGGQYKEMVEKQVSGGQDLRPKVALVIAVLMSCILLGA